MICLSLFSSNYLQDLETNSDDSGIPNSLPKEESFHYCGMPLRKVGSRDAAFMHTQESDDFFKNNMLGPLVMVEDVTNEVTSDALLSATIVPHVHSESDDDHKSYTREENITSPGHESAMEVRNLFCPIRLEVLPFLVCVSLGFISLVFFLYCRKSTGKAETLMNHSAKQQWLKLKLESMVYR